MKNNFKIIIIIIVLVILGAVAYYKTKPAPTSPLPPATTEPVMTPSGAEMSGWQTFSDEASGVTFQYPETISAKYIYTTAWPPKVQIADGPFMCTDAGEEDVQAGSTVEQKINGRSYCITKSSEGAAGSIYTTYTYATEIKDKTQSKVLFLTFTLRAVQCANYSDPEKTACEKERASFSIDPIIDQIAQSVKLK